MNSYLNPGKDSKENILDKKIKEKFIRGYFYFHSTILFIFVDDENSKAVENLLKDCYSMEQDKTIYVIHSIKEGEYQSCSIPAVLINQSGSTELCSSNNWLKPVAAKDSYEQFYNTSVSIQSFAVSSSPVSLPTQIRL